MCRVFLWGVVWVVEKVCGVRVGVGGWRLMGFDSLSLRSHTYELVSTSDSETNTQNLQFSPPFCIIGGDEVLCDCQMV